MNNWVFAWDAYSRYCVPFANLTAIRHADVASTLEQIRAVRPAAMEVRSLGQSFEGREILCATLGSGPRRILAWSQMHGDESTHTAVLLDLLNFLQKAPEHPYAASILSCTTLQAIVMLNPDGAERDTRHNAQGIDINRDALALASPEAKLLRREVEEFRPDIALNLHNHNPRTMVADTRRVAAVSLLAPPIDSFASEAPQIDTAELIASCLCEAIKPHAPGLIARYRAEFMPSAFGEWIQQQGIATLLIEAGGWHHLDATPLRQLHFVGLVSALSAIATDAYRQADRSRYTSLPYTSELELFDLLIEGASIVGRRISEPFVTDLGINGPTNQLQTDSNLRSGSICELGDLRVTAGKSTIDASTLTCMPGRIAWSGAVTPRQLPNADEATRLLGEGITTVVGQLNLSTPHDLEALVEWDNASELPINVGFVATADGWADVSNDRLLQAIAEGVLALVVDALPENIAASLASFNIPHLTFAQLASHCLAELLLIENRGVIELGAVADLVLIPWRDRMPVPLCIDSANLQQVLLDGAVVLDRGKLLDRSAGRLLRRSMFVRSHKS